jgi:hypothetical protein
MVIGILLWNFRKKVVENVIAHSDVLKELIKVKTG